MTDTQQHNCDIANPDLYFVISMKLGGFNKVMGPFLLT